MALTDMQFVSYDAGPGGRHSRGTFKGPASYTTGGETVYNKDFGLASLFGGGPWVGCNSSGVPAWIAYFHAGANRGSSNASDGVIQGKILVIDMADGEEAASTTDLSAIIFTGGVMHGR